MLSILTTIILQVVTGMIGGLAVGAAFTDHSLGLVKDVGVGAVGGGVIGGIVQALVPPMVMASGDPAYDNYLINQLATQAGVGLACGTLLTLIVGFVCREMAMERARKNARDC
jgi:hypothetical protein